MKTFYWLLKREYWENRGLLLRAPLIIGAVFVLITIMGIIASEVTLGHFHFFNAFDLSDLPDLSTINPEALDKAGMVLNASTYTSIGSMLALTAVMMFFYCLGALFNDRNDRSILLWKSLPISDRDTVLAKLVTALVIAPLVAAISGIITVWAIMLIFAITASLHGIGVFELLTSAHPLAVMAKLILWFPVYALWALPTVGWLLLCSAWAKERPFLWALLLPLGAGAMLSWLSFMGLFDGFSTWFWHNAVSRVLLGMFPQGWWFHGGDGNLAGEHIWPHLKQQLTGPGHAYTMLVSPELWIGAAAGAAMVAAAIWLRRWRTEV